MLSNIMINKNYKKVVLAALVTLQTPLVLRAEFFSINKDKIEATRVQLYRSELSRKAVIYTGSLLMTAGIGTCIWRYFQAKPEIDQRFHNLLEKYTNLSEKKRKKIGDILKEKDEAIPDTWRETGIKFIKSGLPILAFEIGKSMAFTKLAEFLNYSLPSGFNLADKFFSNKTISSFVEHNTTLVDTITALNKDINSVITSQVDEESFEADYNMLVTQIEKILGFMLYNSSLLPKDAFAEKNKALIIQKRTVGILLEFLSFIKKLNSKDNLSSDLDCVKSFEDLKKILMKLVDNIESFKEVDKAIDLVDNMSRNVFENIKVMLSMEDLSSLGQEQEVDMANLENLFKDLINKQNTPQ